MKAVRHLHTINMPYAVFAAQTALWQAHVLGAICFAGEAIESAVLADATLPMLAVDMPPLETAAICEIWHSATPLTHGLAEDVRYRCNASLLFGVLTLNEADFVAGNDSTPLQLATEAAYRQIGRLLDSLAYPHVYRYWNYMAAINAHSHGLERYRQFNLGRQQALLAQGREIAGNVPAACALGTVAGALHIAFLAGRALPTPIENPRQLHAYCYPSDYGPRSPIFSRATLVELPDQLCLFVSGTASIVGHASLHIGDVGAQTQETMRNIVAVLAEANTHAGTVKFTLSDLNYKVYVKHVADLAKIRHELTSIIGGSCHVIYLMADVCRQELLLEIEATACQTLSLGKA